MTLARAILIVPAFAGALLFAGCASTPAPADADATAEPKATAESDASASGDQSVTEACEVLAAGAQEFATLSGDDAFAEGMADPEGALAKLDAASTAFSAAVEEVTNPEVQEAAAEADTAMQAYVAYVSDAVADPANADLEGMNPYIQDVQASFTAVGEVCS